MSHIPINESWSQTILFCLRLVSTPNFLHLLWEFGAKSGLQMNKSKFMVFNVLVSETLLDYLISHLLVKMLIFTIWVVNLPLLWENCIQLTIPLSTQSLKLSCNLGLYMICPDWIGLIPSKLPCFPGSYTIFANYRLVTFALIYYEFQSKRICYIWGSKERWFCCVPRIRA